jgi:purine-binding chemotaxis protein CheW
MANQQICTFFLENTCFGIEIEDVQEIIRQQPLTPVPLADPDLCGLINLRGHIIPVVDLSCRLGLRSTSCTIAEETIYNIVVHTLEDRVSFVVDGLGDIVECPVETLEPPPATLDAHVRSCLKGSCKLDHHFLLVLNTQKILDPAPLRRDP